MHRPLWYVWFFLLVTFFAEAPEPLLVSRKQAAVLLGVCLRTVGNLLRSKALTTRRIGTRTLVTMASLKKFIQRDHPVIARQASSAEQREHL